VALLKQTTRLLGETFQPKRHHDSSLPSQSLGWDTN